MDTHKQASDRAFTEWLRSEMDTRNWRPVDLARASGVTLNQVVLVLKMQRRAGDRFLRGVASAFEMPQESVFRLAGMLNDQPESRVREDEFSRKLHHLMSTIEPVERAKAMHLLEQYARDHPGSSTKKPMGKPRNQPLTHRGQSRRA